MVGVIKVRLHFAEVGLFRVIIVVAIIIEPMVRLKAGVPKVAILMMVAELVADVPVALRILMILVIIPPMAKFKVLFG